MPSKDPIQRFADILENIIFIEEFTRGMDLNAYQEDLKTRNATERCKERISEAAKKLGEVAEELCPTVPWPSVRALGNFLRHVLPFLLTKRCSCTRALCRRTSHSQK